MKELASAVPRLAHWVEGHWLAGWSVGGSRDQDGNESGCIKSVSFRERKKPTLRYKEFPRPTVQIGTASL